MWYQQLRGGAAGSAGARLAAGRRLDLDGVGPANLAVSPDGTRAYVTKAFDGTVSVIDPATRQTLASIPVGSSPQGITLSPDGTTAYVANEDSHTISVIDLTASPPVITSLRPSPAPPTPPRAAFCR